MDGVVLSVQVVLWCILVVLCGKITFIHQEAKKKISIIEQNANKKLNEQIKKRNELSKIKIDQMTRDANAEIPNWAYFRFHFNLPSST